MKTNLFNYIFEGVSVFAYYVSIDMQQRKIISLLKILSEDELKAFDRFVRSPFFNENKRLISLFDYLKSFAPALDSPQLNEANAFAIVFGEDVYTEKRLVRLLSKLCKLIDQFIEHYGLLKNEEVGFAYKLAFYEQKNQTAFFEQQLKSFRHWLENNSPKHHRYEHARFDLEKAQSNFLHRQQQYSKGDVNLQEAMNALDHYYLVEKLMLASTMYNRQTVLPVSYKPFFLESMLQELAENLPDFSPTVQTWYRAFCLVREPDSTEIYFQLKEELLEKLDGLDEEDGLAFFLFLQNSLQKAIGQRHPDYYKELFDLYKVQIEKEWILSTNGTLGSTLFHNIVLVALNLHQLNWVESFINQQGKKLKNEIKDDMLSYANALLAFEKNEFRVALKLTALISQKELIFAFGVKRLLVKIYFEENDEEALISAINTFRVYLHRLNRISKRHKEANTAFLNQVNVIIRTKNSNPSLPKMDSIKSEIEGAAMLPERTWLLEKIEEIRVSSF